MKEKLIITVWKAQFNEQILKQQTVYCWLAYNNQAKRTKHLQSKKSLEWKQTFVFPLAQQQSCLRIDFIPLKKGQQIHFAKDNVAESLSLAYANFMISVSSPTKGSLPAKLQIVGDNGEPFGKLLIQYQILKTQVTYLVQKMIDYNYMLKLTNFRVNFLRKLKKTPNIYLKFNYGGKIHREDFPFNNQNEVFYYNYPVKLYMKKEIQMFIELQVKDLFAGGMSNPNQSIRSGSLTDKKSQVSSIGKRNTIDIGFDRISALLVLNLKQNVKCQKKISLTTPFKNQQRQIGFIEFQMQVIFKTQDQRKAIQEQKRGSDRMESQSLSENKQLISPRRKKREPSIQQGNGQIYLTTVMGRLQLQNDKIIKNKNIALTLKLGKQLQQSSVLENPGKNLIFLQSFKFKRTWQQTVKLIIEVYDQEGIKTPIFHSSLNIRQVFEKGKVSGKKCKIYNEQKQNCGQFVLQMEYKQEQKPKKQQKPVVSTKKMSPQKVQQIKLQQKRQQIVERMRRKQEEKRLFQQKKKIKQESRQMISIAQALDLKNLILPPLKSRVTSNNDTSRLKRYSTLSPTNKTERFRSANIYNSNGALRFSRSPRFQKMKQSKGGDSFTLIMESDFDIKKKKGTFIGYGQKYDFTKNYQANPGIGKYSIPSLWDKYQG